MSNIELHSVKISHSAVLTSNNEPQSRPSEITGPADGADAVLVIYTLSRVAGSLRKSRSHSFPRANGEDFLLVYCYSSLPELIFAGGFFTSCSECSLSVEGD